MRLLSNKLAFSACWIAFLFDYKLDSKPIKWTFYELLEFAYLLSSRITTAAMPLSFLF